MLDDVAWLAARRGEGWTVKALEEGVAHQPSAGVGGVATCRAPGAHPPLPRASAPRRRVAHDHAARALPGRHGATAGLRPAVGALRSAEVRRAHRGKRSCAPRGDRGPPRRPRLAGAAACRRGDGRRSCRRARHLSWAGHGRDQGGRVAAATPQRFNAGVPGALRRRVGPGAARHPNPR